MGLHDNGPLTERDLYSAKEIREWDMDPVALQAIELTDAKQIPKSDKRLDKINRSETRDNSYVDPADRYYDKRSYHQKYKTEYERESPPRMPSPGATGGLLGDKPLRNLQNDARQRIKVNKSDYANGHGIDPTYLPHKQKDGAMNRAGNAEILRSGWEWSIMTRRAEKGLVSKEELEKKKRHLEIITNNEPISLHGAKAHGLMGHINVKQVPLKSLKELN